MNKKLKIALIYRTSEQGFALPVAIGLGLIMLLIGATMIVRSQGDQVTASAQKATASSFDTTETGITRIQLLLSKYGFLAAIAILNNFQTRHILMQLRKIKFLVMSKELK